ncbi:MAG: type II toxin-antitoxin system HigB family toxin [Paludibacteraceae bacterium]|nr:type II toxin-antitoxin system HigB family toxin [Paludibacteraceae bacterium]
MRLIATSTIKEYIKKNAGAADALLEWAGKVERAEWHNFNDMRSTFNSVDYVGNQQYVFNIKGNGYRLVAIVLFIPGHVYIRFIGTHKEYDEIKDIKNI